MAHESKIIATYDLGTSNGREYALVIIARGSGFDVVLTSPSEDIDDVVLASGETDLGAALNVYNACIRIHSCGYVKGFRDAEEMSLSDRS